MHLATNRLLLAFQGTAGLALVSGCNQPASQPSAEPSATPAARPTAGPVPPPVQLEKWLKATPNRSLPNCALRASEANPPAVPFFVFGQDPERVPTLDACFIDGPYPWGGKEWYVERIKGVVPPNKPKRDLIRVCSLQAMHPDDPDKFVAGPCRTPEGAGRFGCEVCVENVLPQ